MSKKLDLFALYYRRLATHGAQAWYDQFLLMILIPVGLLYGVVNLLRAYLYKCQLLPSYRSTIPVISVGNIAVGGTGKTPLVDYLLRQQIGRGRKVAVVSRGYGGEKSDVARVVCGGNGALLQAKQCGDEPYLLALRNPAAIVIVAVKRADGIRLAIDEFAVDLIILDDGYQHLAVQRDLNLLLCDSRYPSGNGHVLPAGLLREFSCAAQRADMCIMTRYAGQPLAEFCVDREIPIVRSTQHLATSARSLSGEVYTLQQLQQRRCVAFAGIATPDDFFNALTAMGVNVVVTLPLVDHVNYTQQIIEHIGGMANNADMLLTTEKDAVKLEAEMFALPCCALPLVFTSQDAEVLEQWVEELFN